ncbi:hypothetical protein MBLNU13_g04672t1 [Cladosporium sp. NU13]
MPNSRYDDSQDAGSSKDSQDGSQMLDSVKIQDLVDRHTASVRTRRRSVEAHVRKAQDDGYAALHRRAEAEQRAYKEDLKTAQRPHLEELKELLEEKRHIQCEIDKTQNELERASAAVSQQLIACIKSRVDDLRK